METKKLYGLLLAIVAMTVLSSCHTKRQLVGISKEQVAIDSRYDALIDPALQAYLAPYKQHVDSMASPVVGQTARILNAERPESPLSNMLCDMLVWTADHFYGQKVDFAVYNMGGIRASFPAGDITEGDVLNVAPFNNKPCFLTLTANAVDSLFQEMASVGGEGVSREVRLVISTDGKLLSAEIGGQKVGAKKEYRVATIDYLAQGNDKLEAFKLKYNVTIPGEDKDNMRVVLANYFRAMTAEDKKVDGQLDGRITIK